MYRSIQSISPKKFLLTQLPTLGAALLVAELFFKFGSFGLECIAFLATWYVLDAMAAWLARLIAAFRATTVDPLP